MSGSELAIVADVASFMEKWARRVKSTCDDVAIVYVYSGKDVDGTTDSHAMGAEWTENVDIGEAVWEYVNEWMRSCYEADKRHLGRENKHGLKRVKAYGYTHSGMRQETLDNQSSCHFQREQHALKILDFHHSSPSPALTSL